VTKKERLVMTKKRKAWDENKKERLKVIRIEKEKFNNKIKKGGNLRYAAGLEAQIPRERAYQSKRG
jgi:hypothetical protein